MITFLTTGGPIMWAIVLMGVLALGVFLERAFHLHRARIPWSDFLKGIFNVVERDNIQEALTICNDAPGPVARLAGTAIQHRNENAEVLRATLAATGRNEIMRLIRRFSILATIAQVAPLLGLLGTIFKMVEGVLKIQRQSPLVQRVDVLEPLLQALVIAGAGLTVAIPCYLAYSLLVTKVERITSDMEAATAEILFGVARRARNGNPPPADGGNAA